MLNGGLLRLCFQNLLRQRKRNLAAGLAIGLGFAGLLLLGGYVYRAENLIRVTTIFGSRLGHLVVYSEGGLQGYFAKPWQFSLAPRDQETIAAVAAKTPGVKTVGRVLLGYGLVGNGCKSFPFSAWGLEPELDRAIAQHPDYLKWAGNVSQVLKGQNLYDLPPEEGPILLASGLARLLGKSKTHEELQSLHTGLEGEELALPDCQSPTAKEDFSKDANVQLMSNTWDGHLSILDGEVVGHYFSGRVEHENTGLIAPLSLLQNLFATDNVSFMTIWFEDVRHLERKKEALQAQLAAAGLKVEIYLWSDEAINQFYSGTISFLYTMSLFIGAVMALVIVLSIVNAVTLTILDRRREIGMLRAVGFKVTTVMRLYMLESALLATASLAFGALVGYLAMEFVNGLDLRYQPPGISSPIPLLLVPNIWISLWLSLVVFTLVMTSTFVAAFRSFRQPILYLMESGNR